MPRLHLPAMPHLPAILSRREARQLGRLLFVYGLVGVAAGLAGVLFQLLVGALSVSLHIVPDLAGADGASHVVGPPSEIVWLLVALPALGGLVSGLIGTWFCPEVMGGGANRVIDAYHNQGGRIRHRVPFAKAAASAVTIGSGGSAGLEGPISLVGGGIGALVSDLLRLRARERRVIVVAGMAAGVGAVFHAPMAAAILAAEILYSDRDMESEVLVPSIIACTIAYAVYGAFIDWEQIWSHATTLAFANGLQLVPYTLLAVTVALGAVGFVSFFRLVSAQLGERATIPTWLRPALGGLAVGLIGLLVPGALGTGYGLVQLALDGQLALGLLLILAFTKTVTSCLTTGSGASGGLFAPALIVGGLLGGVIGGLTADLAPGLDVQPAAFVVVGMAGLLAAVLRTPLAAVIMVSELVGDYRLLVPALWVCVLAWILTARFRLFAEQVPTRADAPTQLSDMMGEVLERMTVADAMPSPPEPTVSVPPEMPLGLLLEVFAETTQSVFPIVDPATGRLEGVVDGQLLRRTVGGEHAADDVLIANDFRSPAVTISEADTLLTAITQMSASGYNELLVLDREGAQRLVGLLSRREVVAAYHRKMVSRSTATGAAVRPQPEAAARATDLAAAVRRGGVIDGLEAADAPSALAALVARVSVIADADRPALIDQLLARERLGSTAIGNGYALPHPHVGDADVTFEPTVAIGRFVRPVPWAAVDGQPVHTVCLILAPSGEAHLKLLARLARGLMDPVLADMLAGGAPESDVVARFELLGEAAAG